MTFSLTHQASISPQPLSPSHRAHIAVTLCTIPNPYVEKQGCADSPDSMNSFVFYNLYIVNVCAHTYVYSVCAYIIYTSSKKAHTCNLLLPSNINVVLNSYYTF